MYLRRVATCWQNEEGDKIYSATSLDGSSNHAESGESHYWSYIFISGSDEQQLQDEGYRFIGFRFNYRSKSGTGSSSMKAVDVYNLKLHTNYPDMPEGVRVVLPTMQDVEWYNEATWIRGPDMSLIPENPSKGDTFTNPETAVEYTFDGVKWLASGAEDDGATSEEKIALIESQIQYRGLMDVDADGKPIWPAGQTKDRGGWWAYPSSKFSSLWNYDKLEWIFPFAGEAGDVTKRAAPEYKVGDIIQLQISDNEAGAGTSWQYFDTAPVYVEYKVEEVFLPRHSGRQ